MDDEALKLIESIHEKQRKADVLLQQLRLWREAETQGVDSSQGGSFGLDTRLFTPKEQREYRLHRDRFVAKDSSGRHWPRLYNSFWYPDRRQVRLDPMLEAAPRE